MNKDSENKLLCVKNTNEFLTPEHGRFLCTNKFSLKYFQVLILYVY